MTEMAWFRRGPAPQGETVATLVELAVLVVLLAFLGIAAGKFFLVLGRLRIPAWKGIPLGLAFLAAAAYAARRVSIRARALQRGRSHDSD
jgi:hypothetical protein